MLSGVSIASNSWAGQGPNIPDRKDLPIMSSKPPVHTVPHPEGWANKRAGSDRASRVFDTKAEAQTAGRDTARREQTEHIIHRKDGTIGERNSYGNDPHPPKG